MEICDSVESANVAYSASKEGTLYIITAIKGVEKLSVQEHKEESHAKMHTRQKDRNQDLETIDDKMHNCEVGQ